jgi:hypothetical protein
MVLPLLEFLARKEVRMDIGEEQVWVFLAVWVRKRRKGG